VLTTGTPDLGFGLQAKRQVGPFALTLGAQYIYRFAGVVGYLTETEYNQFQARIKPGDLLTYDANIMFQVGPVALSNQWVLSQRMETRIGTASDDFFGSSNLKPVADSDGAAIDSRFEAMMNVTRGVDVSFGIEQSISGEDLQFFPIEQIHPTRGTTYNFNVELRY
jgi:hypothetical protein